MKLITFLWVLTMLCALPAHPETATVVANEYRPLIVAKNGKIQSCGLHYSAMIQRPDGNVAGSQGSINMRYTTGYYPIFLTKVSFVVTSDSDVRPVSIQHLSLRAGKQDTSFMSQDQGDDGYSRLLAANVLDNPEAVGRLTDGFSDGAWVFVNIHGGSPDVAFKLPSMDSFEENAMYMEYLDCTSALVQRAIDEISSTE